MATVEKIENELKDAKEQLNEAKAALKNFEEGKRGQKLKVLEDKLYEEEELTEKEKDLLKRLEEVKKKLEIEKDEWKAQVQKLQNSLMEITKIGNDFVTCDLKVGDRVYDWNSSVLQKDHAAHGGKINEKFDSLLTDWDDGTCDENNTYTTLSDMYQLGKLLERLNTVSSDDGKDFISKLKKKMLGADAALQHPWIVSI
ncbi:hypothetical protein G9A89_001589 [Geosiphon pyriformis]|nr:hypothetical protein G9A89_001589 [Geosiphon pyriformis]